ESRPSPAGGVGEEDEDDEPGTGHPREHNEGTGAGGEEREESQPDSAPPVDGDAGEEPSRDARPGTGELEPPGGRLTQTRFDRGGDEEGAQRPGRHRPQRRHDGQAPQIAGTEPGSLRDRLVVSLGYGQVSGN